MMKTPLLSVLVTLMCQTVGCTTTSLDDDVSPTPVGAGGGVDASGGAGEPCAPSCPESPGEAAGGTGGSSPLPGSGGSGVIDGSTDECDSTLECNEIHGPEATDCSDSQSETSVCLCGSAPCGEPQEEPSDVTRLYHNPLDSLADVQALQNTLVNDGTDQLLENQSGSECWDGGCLSVLHDYGGQNEKTAKVNSEFALGKRSTEATLQFRVKFDSGFDFRKQGKLPGIIPKTPHFGGNKADPPHPSKWSARVMWLKTGDPDADGIVKPDLYLYDQDRQVGQTGEHNNSPAFSFKRNTWHTVTLYLKLNSTGSLRDGRAELWVDGQLMSCRTNKLFRGNESQDSEIQGFAFHNYFGGSADYDWPTSPQHSFFDELEVLEGRATPRIPDMTECDDSIRNQ